MEQSNPTTKLKLLSTLKEAGNVRTFLFETGGLTWIAGQFQEYKLEQAGKKDEENQRWFTIASAPSEGTINISTRMSDSAFKQALNNMRPGDEIERRDVDGDFIWEQDPDDSILLVAAGIGVTPFRSFLIERDHQGKKINARLLYFNRNDEIPFMKEFNDLSGKHPEFKVEPIVGERITARRILELAPEAKTQVVYISGAEPMVTAISADLEKAGVKVKQDQFPGYTEETY